jgi:uncharacterized protein GlcG (DUF336 family)/sugar lactone lactonase YvrE
MAHFFSKLITRARGLRWLVALTLGAGVGLRAADSTFALADLQQIFTQASDRAAEIEPNAVIAIVDRDGRALLVRRANGSTSVTATERALAVAKAGTAVFLSSNGEAFTSRTAGFIIQQNFPPGVLNTAPGPLVGVGFSNLAYSDINYLHAADGSRISGTRLDGSPGGVPLYKNNVLVAGIGVTGDGTEQEDASITGPDNDETVALAGQMGYEPSDTIKATNVYIAGISLPYVGGPATAAAHSAGLAFDPTGLSAPSPVSWPTALLGGVVGEVHAPIRGDPLAGMIDGQPRLTAAEVQAIIANAAARTLVTRGGIRLPAGQPAAVFITVVNNPAQAGLAPVVLGTFRTPDATIFSWDVSAQKARTAVFFSSGSRAFSTRTVGYLAQSNFPPGIANQPPGPFNGLQERFSIPLLSGTAGSNPNLPNGITIFPGGFPLYRNGVLVGAIGVSGDGVDQDDLIAASGTAGFQPSPVIRADNFLYLGARLPYAKFPRDAELRPGIDPVATLPAGFEYLATNLDAGTGLPDLGSQLSSGNGATGTDPAGTTSGTTSGGGTAQGSLPFPVAIALDGAGNLYVGDAATDTIRKITSAGVVTLLAGSDGVTGTADGSGPAARFSDPAGVSAASDGTLTVSDTANATIRRITTAGNVTTLAGSTSARGNVDATGPAATFSSPIGLVQSADGTIFVADAMNHTIRRISAGGVVSTLAGTAGVSGDADGTGPAARFNYPTGLALDGSGNLYVTDSTNNLLRKITPTGVVTTLAGLNGVSGSQDGSGSYALFNNPTGLAIDGLGNLYVADTGNSLIRHVTPAGVVTTLAGLPGVAGYQNGTLTSAWFNQPRAVALDASGNLYVADTGNAAIRKITPAGVVSTLTLTAGSTTTDGGGTITVTTGAGGGTVTVTASTGGGGAVSGPFLGALSALTLVRWLRRRKRV